VRRSGCYSQERDCEGCGTDMGGGVNCVPEFGCCINTNTLLSFPRCVGVKNCLPLPHPPQSSNYYYASRVLVFRCLRKIAKSDYWIRHICLSTQPHDHLGSHSTCFQEIVYLNIFRKSVEKIPISLKPETHNGYFT